MWFAFKMWWLKKYDRVFNPRLLRDYGSKIPQDRFLEPGETLTLQLSEGATDIDHFEF